MNLQILPLDLSVCRMDAQAPLPEWASASKNFFNISKTNEELSIVTETTYCPDNIACESGWLAIKVCGPLDFALTGILASLTKPLAEAAISIFAISTYDTDYVLIKKEKLKVAKEVLIQAGYQFI